MNSINQIPSADDIRTLDGRRTLLIGLGSTGAKVCNQIIERLAWTYDSPENVPWLRCLVMETADVAAEKLVRKHARFYHASIDNNSYKGLISNPAMYSSQMAFSDWNIPSLTKDEDAILFGANNTRILGRLAFLFPHNFTAIRKLVIQELEELQKLDNAAATALFQKSSDEPVQVSLSRQTNIYVVGTLCGGTASGSFIDMGYMLRNLSGYDFRTTGMFLMPATTEQNELYVANTYAALVELNHFSSETTRYRQQLPNQRSKVTYALPGTSPYNYVYLAQSSGATLHEYATLLTATADYLYSDIVGSSSIARDGDRTNISNFFNQRDFWGATQKYFTFGLSTIEFPYAKVAKACALRLMHRGFQELGSGPSLKEGQISTRLAEIPLLQRKSLRGRLLQGTGGQLEQVISQVLREASPQIAKTDEAMALVRRQINAAFDGAEALHNPSEIHRKLPARIIPQTIEQNLESTEEELRNAIIRIAKELLDANTDSYGIVPLESFLKALEETLDKALSPTTSASADSVLTQLNAQAESAYHNVEKCRRSCWARRSMGRHTQVFLDQCDGVYNQRLNAACHAAIEDILRMTQEFVKSALRRLNDTEGSLQKEVSQLLKSLDELYVRTDTKSGTTNDGWERVVNGLELYTPTDRTAKSGTVEQEYWTCLRALKKQQKLSGNIEELEVTLARLAVQSYAETATAELFADMDLPSRLDSASPIGPSTFTDSDLVDMIKPARKNFQALKQRSVVDRLLALGPTLQQTLQDAALKSHVFLDWDEGHPRYFHQEQKAYAYVFYDAADPRAATFQAQLTAAGVFAGDERKATNLSNPHQVLFLSEQGAFSLGTVSKLKDEEESDWRNNYQNPLLESLHARGDIKEWVTWAQRDEDARVHLRALFLVSVALEIIRFQSANDYQFSYKKKSSADKGFMSFSRDLDETAQEIISANLEKEIEIRIAKWRQENGDFAAVERLDSYIEQSAGKFTEGGRILGALDIEAYILDFILRDQSLEAIYHGPQFYEDEVEQTYRKPDETGTMALFCPHCERKLGYNIGALYVQKEIAGEMVRCKECVYCERPL